MGSAQGTGVGQFSLTDDKDGTFTRPKRRGELALRAGRSGLVKVLVISVASLGPLVSGRLSGLTGKGHEVKVVHAGDGAAVPFLAHA